MNRSKTVLIINTILGKFLTVFGYFMGGFSLIIMCVGVTDLKSSGAFAGMVFLFIILGLSILAIIKGYQIKQMVKRFKTYVSLISIENITSLEDIASSTSQSVDFVKNDLQKMIDKKFFANAYIDKQSNEIIIGSSNSQPSVPISSESFHLNVVTEIETESVQCLGCGAMNLKQKGGSGNCDYCGSLL